jgi:hypothetical protein
MHFCRNFVKFIKTKVTFVQCDEVFLIKVYFSLTKDPQREITYRVEYYVM